MNTAGGMSVGIVSYKVVEPDLGPVVADCVREDLSVVVEGALGERLVQHLRGLESRARVLVPEREGAVRAHRGQRAVRRVERDVVHRVDVLRHVSNALMLPTPHHSHSH